ncbi:MAG: methionine adenosyltransferase [Verrucomicrobia bacterium]|jgi:S-adenosylmethionine synthetase|nr:methionine adenosyltransferase [Verrucomicrobiota bacterium]MBT7069203.1 methionine adenosyltransferase [Verrucomicrobiota bacterium]MBT7700776.1 methionine adenosyltransferase [Verrucomicrobiota bacterium]
MSNRLIFTSESVTEGHPDKVADGISDAILDAHLTADPYSRVACETMVSTGMVVVAGEITSEGVVSYPDVVREKLHKIGYSDTTSGFGADSCAVLVSLDRQSADISQGVTVGKGLHKEQGAGDQGMMFGYACNETRELMPMAIMFANRLTRQLAKARRSRKLPFLLPDGKAQVSVVYENGKPVALDTVVVSSQHTADVSHRKLTAGIVEEVVKKVIPERLRKKTRYLINPTGRFVVGGPHGDCGLTGRKIIVDTYGGMGRHGGGAFSGKDPSKVDRSAAYMARYVAKNIVAAKLAQRCEVQLAYAIGFADPVSVNVNSFDTGTADDGALAEAAEKVFGLRPSEIVETLDLLRPIYEPTSAYGHFGRSSARDLEAFTWEKTDKVDALKAAL